MSLISIQLRFDARLKLFAAGAVHPAHVADLQVGEQLYEPTLARPYYTGRVTGYDRQPLGVGPDPHYREDGIYQVSVHRAQNEAETAAIIAAAIADYFKRASVLAPIPGAPPQPAIQILSASEMPGFATAGWINIPVVIRWFTTG